MRTMHVLLALAMLPVSSVCAVDLRKAVAIDLPAAHRRVFSLALPACNDRPSLTDCCKSIESSGIRPARWSHKWSRGSLRACQSRTESYTLSDVTF